jgi:hypothetical protein
MHLAGIVFASEGIIDSLSLRARPPIYRFSSPPSHGERKLSRCSLTKTQRHEALNPRAGEATHFAPCFQHRVISQ